MVASTLNIINAWYIESSQNNDRTELLSKLAVLEFCGWLEHWMDDFIVELSSHSTCPANWVTSNVIDYTNGFEYKKHLRGMLVKIMGEYQVLVGEARFESQHPGDLAQIKSSLSRLWKDRCSFAHSDVSHNIQAQVVFNAPSWTLYQYSMLERKLNCLKAVFVKLVQDLPNP